MNSDLLEIIKIINNLNLNEKIILIGSWVEFFYQDLIHDYYAQFVTNDYDFLINRPVSNGKNFIKEMVKAGFTYTEDYITNKSKFYKDSMEVEFLTNRNREGKQICIIENLGIKAESLNYLEILMNNTISVNAEGYNIKIPSPDAYCIHKMIINPSRSEWKKQKDIDSVISILNKMIENRVYLNELKALYSKLGKKQKKIVNNVINKYSLIEFEKIINECQTESEN